MITYHEYNIGHNNLMSNTYKNVSAHYTWQIWYFLPVLEPQHDHMSTTQRLHSLPVLFLWVDPGFYTDDLVTKFGPLPLPR